MVAMSGTSQVGAGSNYPLVKGAFRLEFLCMWKDQTNSCFVTTLGCFVTTFGCYVTIFIVTKCYALQQEEKKG
jgi:hypothetical protein